MEKILNESLSLYETKTATFNKKPTVLVCRMTEEDGFSKLSKQFDIAFDEKIILDVNATIPQTFHHDKNYFFSNQVMCRELYAQLLERGMSEQQIYVGSTKNEYFDLYPKRYVIYDNMSTIKKAWKLFADEKSRRTFLKIITRLCLPYQYHYLYEPTNELQYFPSEFSFSNEEIFLDAGVCDGQNILEFIEHVDGKYKFIYGIEADLDNLTLTKKILKNVDKLELIHGALSSTQGQSLRFRSSKITGKKGNARVQDDGDCFVTSITGDSLKKTPTFIKMDIEGSEKDALIGLSHTIKNYTPKLAICVYHFQKDFWEIPLLIHTLNPKYKLLMRNYEQLSTLLETVCYAFV